MTSSFFIFSVTGSLVDTSAAQGFSLFAPLSSLLVLAFLSSFSSLI
jgi:hypothetical protein